MLENKEQTDQSFEVSIPPENLRKSPPNQPLLGVRGDWKIIERDADGNVLSTHGKENVVTLLGRDEVLKMIFGFTGSASGQPAIAMAVGASAVTGDASDPNDIDTHLEYELIADTARKSPLLNTSGAALSSSDIVSEETTIASCTYYRKIVVQATYDTADPNNGNVFKEFGLFTTAVLPGTPTGTSGIMFNRFEDPDPLTKTSSNALTVQVTLRV